ncbi:MAG: InlB B-repeat-containing protein, partial [Chloroflexi bacterium]|nr:InlB B-repeat-containing protein [Chloroflexota bacterium]
PDQATYTYGQVVTLTAFANPGYTFANWTGDAMGTANPITVTMNANKNVTANYTQNQYTLTINTVGSGVVTKSPDQATYTYGQVVTLTAFANPGYTFANWSGDLVSTTNPVTVMMNTTTTVTATFTQDHYTLNITSLNGTVAKNPDQATYTYGQVVTLTATANLGYTFANWTGDATGTANPITVTMNANKNVTANYTQNQYTLTITSLNGTVTKNPDQATYTYGQVVNLTAMNANKNVTANYTQNQYTLTITSLNGTVTKNPNQTTYTYGQVVTLTAFANPGWTFGNWSGDLVSSANPVTVTMDANKNVTANYTQNQYTLTITSLNGTVTKNPNQATYTYGQVVNLTATANLGYTFANWTGDAMGTANPVTVTMDENKSVTANYTQNQYTLTINTVGSGVVTKSPDQATYTYGQVVTLTAFANPGYAFANWTGDALGTANPVTITMDENKNVTANFTPLPSANFDAWPQSGAIPLTVSMHIVSTANIATCSWTYGDGQTSTACTAYHNHVYNSGGTFTVSLTVTSPSGLIDTMTRINYISTVIPCYALATSANPTGSGTTSASPVPNCANDNTKYISGTVVTLTANASSGYSFASWSGDANGTTNPTTLTMNANQSVIANYDPVYPGAISSVNPAPPYCILRNSTNLYDRVLELRGQSFPTSNHQLQFRNTSIGTVSIWFDSEVNWESPTRIWVDIGLVKGLLWSDPKVTLNARITTYVNGNFQPFTAWSPEFNLANDATTCGTTRPTLYLPLIKR